MLSEEALEKLTDRLVERAEDLNMFMLKKLARQIRKIGELTPSQLREVYQSVKYGNDLNEIITKIAMFNKMNEQDVVDVFESVANKNQNYAKKFYEYRNISFIPYSQNAQMKSLVRALAKQTNNLFQNFSKTSAFGILQADGSIRYSPLSEIYQRVTDEAILSIVEGRETYQTNMKRTMKELSKGIQVVDFASGYHRRIDSQVRMNLLDGVRQLENQMQEQFGDEFLYNGIEVMHHEHPAPDHSSEIDGGHDIDGKQFAQISKIRELQSMGYDLDIKIDTNKAILNGKTYLDYNHINSELNRPVSTINCYHLIRPIILGVSEPTFSKEELEKDKEENLKGFDFEGHHYTMYEGTQLQRKLETEIRKAKEKREFYKEAGNDFVDDYLRYDNRVTLLRNKYKKLSRISGLEEHINRLQV